MEKKYYTLKEAKELLGVSRDTLKRMGLKFIPLREGGRKKMILKSDIDQHMKKMGRLAK